MNSSNELLGVFFRRGALSKLQKDANSITPQFILLALIINFTLIPILFL